VVQAGQAKAAEAWAAVKDKVIPVYEEYAKEHVDKVRDLAHQPRI
jgi:hypothetical protein